MISWSEFEKVDMRVGVVVDAQEFPEAKNPAYRLWVDLGPLGVKRSSAYTKSREVILLRPDEPVSVGSKIG